MLQVDDSKLDKSIKALVNRHKKGIEKQIEKKDLLISNEDSHLFLIINLKQTPANKGHSSSSLPIPLLLPNSNPFKKICIFVKDPDSVYKQFAPENVTVFLFLFLLLGNGYGETKKRIQTIRSPAPTFS